MLKTIKIAPWLEDLFKVIVSLKVFIFLVITAIEGFQSMRENHHTNICVQFIKQKVSSEKIDQKEALAKSVHYCNGGKKNIN